MSDWSIWDWLSALTDLSIIVTGGLLSVVLVLFIVEHLQGKR